MTFNGSIRAKRRSKREPTSRIRYVTFYRDVDDKDEPQRGTVWSVAPGRQRLWVVPLDGPDRSLTLIRYINPRWVLDTDPPDTIA